MKNSTIYRSNLSNEKVAFLSEIKNLQELDNNDNTPKTYKRQKENDNKEIDILWQGFKTNSREEKSPGIYLLTGFVAGALFVFVMNSILSISSDFTNKTANQKLIGQSKYEKKISRKEKIPQINNSSIAVVPAQSEIVENTAIPANETYTVKSGDSMSSIVYRFYGKYDIDKIEKIKQVNNLESTNKLSIGQQLIIPLD